TRPDANRLHGDIEGSRPIRHGNPFTTVHPTRELLFETRYKRSFARNPTGFQTLEDISPFVAVQERLVNRNKFERRQRASRSVTLPSFARRNIPPRYQVRVAVESATPRCGRPAGRVEQQWL